MRWTRVVMGAAVGLLLLAASIQPAGAQSRDNRGGAQSPRRSPLNIEERDNLTGAIFSAEPDGQGNARFAVSVGDFVLEKILAPSGDTTIRLTQGEDLVTVVIDHNGYAGRGQDERRGSTGSPGTPRISIRFNPSCWAPERRAHSAGSPHHWRIEMMTKTWNPWNHCNH